MLPPEITDDGFGEKITTFSLSKKIPVFIRIGLALPLMPIRTAPLPACNAQSSERQVTTATATNLYGENGLNPKIGYNREIFSNVQLR